MEYRVRRFKQGSKSWLSWRSQGIGASDASSIMGKNYWLSWVYGDRLGLLFLDSRHGQGLVKAPSENMYH